MVLSVSVLVQVQLRLGDHIGRAGRKPASIASATDMERADPCAGLGKCDSRVATGQVLEAFLLLLLQPMQEFLDGLLHLLLIRSSINVFFIVRIGGRLRRRWVWMVQSSVTKTCVYHDILPGLVILGYHSIRGYV